MRYWQLAVVLFAFAVTAPREAFAQSPGTITSEQITATGATTARGAIAQLAPHWLATSRDGRTVVYVNGSLRGAIDELDQIPAEVVSSIEYLAGLRVHERLTAQSANGVAVAIFVSTFSSRATAPSHMPLTRAMIPTVILHYAVPFAAGRTGWEEGHMEAWADEQTVRDTGPAALLLSGRFDVPSTRFFVDAMWWRESRRSAEHFRRSSTGLYSNVEYDTEGGALIAGARIGVVRVGAGPATVNTDFTTSYGECACMGIRYRQHNARGVAAQATSSLRLRGPVLAELRVMAQHTRGERIAIWAGGPEVEIGGTRYTVSAGLRVGRR